MKGRKAKPAHLKAVPMKGAQKRVTDLEIPEPPRSLSRGGRDIWPQVIADLSKFGIVDRVDVHALATYCNAVARMMDAQAFIEQHGETYETIGKGGRMFRKRPELAIIEECEAKIARFSAEFGMTPASRTKFGDPNQGRLPLDDDPT